MTVGEFLRSDAGKNQEVAFLICEAQKETSSPFYTKIYRSTPLREAWEWLDGGGSILDYYILNDAQEPIEWLSGGAWRTWFRGGWMKNLLVIDDKNLHLLYQSNEQCKSLVEFCDEKIREHWKEVR